MPQYKIMFGISGMIIDAVDTTAAQSWAASYKPGVAYTVEELPTATLVSNATIKVAADLQFGNQLYFEFLVDNETTPATPQEVIAMFVKFGDAKNALLAGAIVQARYIVNLLTTDSLFTQERKDKYLAMMDAYLSQYL
jgi:hypothetical protein